MLEIDKLNELAESHGELRRGKGMVTGTIAISLAVLCFLGVLVFHFPQYLSTPELRKSYNVDLMRWVLLVAMVVSAASRWSTSSSTARAGSRPSPSS